MATKHSSRRETVSLVRTVTVQTITALLILLQFTQSTSAENPSHFH